MNKDIKNIILVDGNNLLFRSYYATAYSGNMMNNSKGFPTNALYGFVNMMNKIIDEEDANYILVAFDKGRTFRHDKYTEYKSGREQMPDELRVQFPVAKKILTALGIRYLEIDNYEADDIIGTFSYMVDNNSLYKVTIVSSDKDLLQLISNNVEVRLLKNKDYIRMNEEVFYNTYGISPIHMIDLKSLMGDSSDNIPGVKGIGEKTALKLLKEYNTLEDVYDNIDNIKGSLREKLITYKEDAFMSKDLATIYRSVPLDISIDDIIYKKVDNKDIVDIYTELEFYSFLRKMDTTPLVSSLNNSLCDVCIIDDVSSLKIDKPLGVYLELSEDNYHRASIIGMGIYNDSISGFIPYEVLKKTPSFLTKVDKYTYDLKRVYVSLKENNISFKKCSFDLSLAAYLLNYTAREDIFSLASSLGYDIPSVVKKDILDINDIYKYSVLKAKFIYEQRDKFILKLIEEDLLYLFNEIEMPLSITLGDMEYNGIKVDTKVLFDMRKEIKSRIEVLSNDIYKEAGCTFNISSPKQLGLVLFSKLKLPYAKMNKTGYITDANVLNKLKNYHPIIDMILEYRMLSKLYTTYVEGILNAVSSDGRIHTIYTQTLTRTGRLSSIEPNLQNIPIRYEYGRLIRKCFVADKNCVIMSCDYSQIELRVFAHISSVDELIMAFKNDLDIHAKTASDIFHVPIDKVDKDMRRKAKAVNFGIIYGISGYGLATDLGITPKEGKEFISRYLDTYPGVNDYMKRCIEKAHEDLYVTTIMNRKRLIPELNNKNKTIVNMGERMALNTPIQGSSADILKKAMNEIAYRFKKEKIKSKMLLQIHDELIFNVYMDELEVVKNIVRDIMENTYKLNVPLKVDIEIGNNMYEAK